MAVTDLEPASINTCSTTTLTGEGQLDKDCTGASFDATVSAKGVKLTSCSGDASQDVECKLPLVAGAKARSGKTDTLEVKVTSIIPPSLASAVAQITSTDADTSEQSFRSDVHTKEQMEAQQ